MNESLLKEVLGNLSRPATSLEEEIRQLKKQLASAELKAENSASELNKSEERFSLAMRRANDGLWDWNIETGEVYFSPRWKNMLGYKEDDLDSAFDTWASLIHIDDRDHAVSAMQHYLNGDTDSFEHELRMSHKNDMDVFVLSRALLLVRNSDNQPIRLIGNHIDITEQKKAASFKTNNARILEMIALGRSASDIYNAIALMYEARHPGMRCSMLELHDGKLIHGGAPSLPKEYCDAVNGLKNGPSVGSCGTSTYTGECVLVEDIETDPKWEKIKHFALPHGMRCCWSEPIKNASGDVLGAFGMYYDQPALPNEDQLNDLSSAAKLTGIVMERDQAQKRIWELAYTDELTKLSSRAHFYLRLNDVIKTSERAKRRFGLLYIDLDDFKSINDSLGHDTGDDLLVTVAERLASTCRDIDFIARLSGDEFCILIPEVDDDHTVVNVAQRCLKAIAQPVELATRKHIPACSIGIAHYPEDGEDATTLIKAADTSLYAAKENGKNRYAFYKPELTRKAEYRFQVEQYLREAIETQQLHLEYQPQVDLKTGKIIGVEALSRWTHPILGNVPPIDFIATAERIGMIKLLTEWVLNVACRQTVAWKEDGLPLQRLAVNISPSHFIDQEIVPLIDQIISETGIKPNDLELEVTESVIQTDSRNLITIRDLKDLNLQLAIDDFGTGYSSFASLKHLDVDCLKIDKYFIDDMLTNKKASILIGSMIEMGHQLGYKIIAEGIETSEQLDTLKSLDCDAAQGYLFSKPVDTDTISRLLGNSFNI